MADYDNTNKGSIWKNDKKANDNHPDFTGSINVDGVDYWVSAWKRKECANAKAPALTFSLKLKDSAITKPKTPSNEQKSGFDDFESDIPF